MSALEELKSAYAERVAAARAWKAKGGKVVAYLDHTTPQELIEAAGFFPYRITGNPDAYPESLEKYLFPIWRKASLADRQVKLAWVNSMLDALYTDRFEFVDYLVITYSRKNFMAFWEQLTDAKRWFPELRIPELFVLDRAMTPYFHSSEYNRESILLLKAQLEKWSGKPITDEALNTAIAARDKSRELLGKVEALRKAEPPKVSGADALALHGVAHFLRAEDFNARLEAALPELEKQPPRKGARLFIAGSPQDHSQLYDAVESTGATVVGEDSFWGQRQLDYPLEPNPDPTEAIANRYHKQPPAAEFPLEKAVQGCADRAVAAKAQAGIFYVYNFDNHQLFDVPDGRAKMEEAGIRTIYLQEQPYGVKDQKMVAGEARRLAALVSEENV